MLPTSFHYLSSFTSFHYLSSFVDYGIAHLSDKRSIHADYLNIAHLSDNCSNQINNLTKTTNIMSTFLKVLFAVAVIAETILLGLTIKLAICEHLTAFLAIYLVSFLAIAEGIITILLFDLLKGFEK